jgi:tetratricopeptide (TPR) repeat protein
MKERYLVLALIFIFIYSTDALKVDTTLDGQGNFYSYANSNYDQFEETINATGIHKYSRNIETNGEISAEKIDYAYINGLSQDPENKNSSYHRVLASSPIGLNHMVAMKSNKTTVFQANLSSDAISLSTDYNIWMKWGNISESISYDRSGEELLPTGPRFQSEMELGGNYSLASKVSEQRPDLAQRDDASELRYQLNGITVTGESPVTEIRIQKRPIRTVSGIALLPNQSADIYYGEALKLVKSARNETDGDKKTSLLNLALDNLSEALEDNPEDYKANAEMAYILYMQGRFEEAVEAYDNALKIQKTPEAYISKAEIQDKNLGDYLGASKSYRAATELEPSNYMTYANLAANLIEIGDYEGAVSACDDALEIYDRYQYALYLKGLAKYYLHEDQVARTILHEAIDLDPDSDYAARANETLGLLGPEKIQ